MRLLLARLWIDGCNRAVGYSSKIHQFFLRIRFYFGGALPLPNQGGHIGRCFMYRPMC